MKGKVKWFDKRKGFGYITGEDGTDYFVHYSAIVSDKKRKQLSDDQDVEFTPGENEKGLLAAEVKAV